MLVLSAADLHAALTAHGRDYRGGETRIRIAERWV